MTLHLCPDIIGLFGNKNGESGTIRSNCSDATIVTSKTAPSTPIDYLVPCPKPPIIQTSTVEKEKNTYSYNDRSKRQGRCTKDMANTYNNIFQGSHPKQKIGGIPLRLEISLILPPP